MDGFSISAFLSLRALPLTLTDRKTPSPCGGRTLRRRGMCEHGVGGEVPRRARGAGRGCTATRVGVTLRAKPMAWRANGPGSMWGYSMGDGDDAGAVGPWDPSQPLYDMNVVPAAVDVVHDAAVRAPGGEVAGRTTCAPGGRSVIEA